MSNNIIVVILVCALVTAFIRAVPFVLLGGKKVPKIVSYLSDVLPPAIMIILVLYCLRNTKFMTFPYGAAKIISVIITVLVQLWKKNSILTIIIIGTACYMILIRTAFPV